MKKKTFYKNSYTVLQDCKTEMEYAQEKFGIITNKHNSQFCLTSISMLLFLLHTEIFNEEALNDILLISFSLK
jgi:hypothetical protein